MIAMRILIVEDSSVDAHLLARLLNELNYRDIEIASSGKEAIEKTFHLKPHLIFMDIELEGQLNGIETSHKINELHKIPVIYTSRHSSRNIIQRIKSAPPAGYLLKPIDRNSLYVSLELAIQRYNFEKRLEESEIKYRVLVENSSDLIFSLDERWRFITVNNAVKKLLKMKNKDLISKSFLDLIHNGDKGLSAREIVEKKLTEFSMTGEPINFKAEFKSPLNSEPLELQVRMEYIKVEDKYEILGKASRVIEDSLMKYFISEKQKFIIGNYLVTADDISHRITRNLRKYMNQKEINILRIALREIIINAIEHGNLNISFDEKTEAINNGNYFKFLANRQNDPEIGKKHVNIEYQVDPHGVIYKITDQGEGFDFNRVLNEAYINANTKKLSHGRGIIMAKNAFDRIHFNKKGNEVILEKNFDQGHPLK